MQIYTDICNLCEDTVRWSSSSIDMNLPMDYKTIVWNDYAIQKSSVLKNNSLYTADDKWGMLSGRVNEKICFIFSKLDSHYSDFYTV